MLLDSAVIFTPSLVQQVQAALTNSRVLFFSAPCGFGKTTAARALLEGRTVLALNAMEPGLSLPPAEEAWDTLLVDELQDLREEEGQALAALIREERERRFVLLELAPFETFGVELARMVSGDNRAGERLGHLQKNTSILLQERLDTFRFWPIFRRFLQWELEQECPADQQKALYIRGGLYYELREDYGSALECYSKAGDHRKVSELLEKNAQLHPGMGHYEEVEPYYLALPEEEILSSPALMQGMSMLRALELDYEGSERWYQALRDFSADRQSGSAARREAKGRLAWLDIALPQRGVNGLAEQMPAVFRLLTTREIELPPFSMTSTMPSLMNGGKDFSDWSKIDDLLYQTLRRPVEAILGRDGVGLGELALGKTEDALLTLAPLAPYYAACARHLDTLHLHVMRAVARERLGDGGWKEDLGAALDLSLTYRFVRPVASYGGAVLPLLTKCGWTGDSPFLAAVTLRTREQAAWPCA